MALTPPGDLLLREFDLAAGAVASIVASGHDVFTSWEWSVSPSFPAGVEVREAGDTLIVGWPDVVPDLFPIESIEYLDAGELKAVQSWAAVPPAAEIISFRADPMNKREYVLTVTAHGIEAGMPASATGEFLIQILQQYNANRDILLERINVTG